ncbi:tryptophan-rich sensory protein TspO [Pseudomonas vancouverensis]|uniref:Tryptophan-rich sensory protein n=1 Tax=Pseudomonas vancouverensis TaxID=95300 RepID=A0A1H2NG28_PSEVA|nr:TspO/MBR family protein [Pseudomonas vancouverensis]KAB0489345.1 tryptophan-rich sensory protein [Pseudomonas vancouverensis]TDB60957.1 tryptophan-rich sensory protein [Pseudomonas vancouverensis]SDV04340.1 TspO and MBR related proteins [Pseudomonas vancouverensis]
MTFYIFLLACGSAASAGLFFKPGQWYESLTKPGFTPPNWVFPVAWTTIYLLLAWAGYRLTQIPGSQVVLALWAAQIALNTLWTPVFFGAQRVLASMVILSLLWLVVAVMIVLAMQLDVITGLILFPYLLWLCLAGALNLWILRSNR